MTTIPQPQSPHRRGAAPGRPAEQDAWKGFRGGLWRDAVDVRDFVPQNYTPYEGDGSFLAGPTHRTTAVWNKLLAMFPRERERGVYDVDTATPSTITAFGPGYVDEDLDLIVGKQADRVLLDGRWPTEDVIRDREENAEQIRALRELKEMAASYGYDVSRPAARPSSGCTSPTWPP
jgi:pyruvate-formate lyase